MTETARAIWMHELPETPFPYSERLLCYDNSNLFAPPASGSHPSHGMLVVPCSMGSMAKMAHGIGDSLLLRAADVCLKERRSLILAPRETPLSLIHIENMKKLTCAGAIIAPPVLSFYNHETTLEQIAREFAYHLIELLGYPSPRTEWKGGEKTHPKNR